MQFHLNGFRPGDPEVPAQHNHEHVNRCADTLPSEVDVLIVGCGPAGLTLAAQLAAFPDIKTCIVEQKPGPLLIGQADGIACRTMEIFEAFGFSHRVLRESCWINEVAFWKPDEQHPERIVRARTIPDVQEGVSEFPHVVLSQARVHDFYLDVMRNSLSRLEPFYSRRLINLHVSPEQRCHTGEHAVSARFERTDPARQGETETLRARFVVGCDGARSAVRESLGIPLRGDSANQAWGVMDVLAVTDFPDVRRKSTIHSANQGTVLIIPREGGYLIRLYVELDKLNENERIAARGITVDHLIAAARGILRPYTLDVKEIAWWSVYEIGQRLCDKFDDVTNENAEEWSPRVFIAGDACHTHSPKAGQGMNVSMQDSFNLGWKLASVLSGRCSPRILDTYSVERHSVAKELIEFDREMARLFSARPKSPSDSSTEGITPAEFQNYFIRQGRFTSGTATCYSVSMLTGNTDHQHLAQGFGVGTRFHSAPVIRAADAKAVHLGHTLRADGRWRLIAFADESDPAAASSRIHRLCEFLSESPESPLTKYTPGSADTDSLIEPIAVFQQSHLELAMETMPSLLLPRKGRYGLIDYEKIFCADRNNDIFESRMIDRKQGCIVIVRPDQHIANVLPLSDFPGLASFFDGFMMRPANLA